MKIIKINIFLLMMLFFLCSNVIFADSDFLSAERLINKNAISLPEVKKFKTKQGLNVIYIKDEIPQFTVTLFVGYGTLYEKSDNAGTASLLSKTLSLCGSKKYPGNSLNAKIESLGGKISIGTDWEGIILSIQVLQEYSEQAIKILADLIENPNFNDKSFQLAKSLLKEQVKHEKDSPFSYAYSYWREIVFQKQGYGARTTVQSLEKIDLSDLVKIWEKYVNSKNMAMGITSTIPLTKIKNYVKNNLSFLKNGKIQNYMSKIDNNILKENSKKIFFIPRNIPQATIVIGSPAPGIKFSGKYSLKVLNYILGGGSFNSRLMQEIRVKRGLAYATGSIIRFRKNSGIFVIYAQTGTDKTIQGFKIIKNILNNLQKTGVTDKEIKNSKMSIINSYIFKYDTLDSILSQYLSFWYNNIDASEIKNYPIKIKNVNKNDINISFEKVINNGVVTLIIGDPKLKEQLAKFSEVVVIEE